MDQGGKDWKRDAAMVKLQGTEMVGRVVDRAMQLFGGMGMSKDLPLEYMYRACRVWRIFEGRSEVHRWLIARDLGCVRNFVRKPVNKVTRLARIALRTGSPTAPWQHAMTCCAAECPQSTSKR